MQYYPDYLKEEVPGTEKDSYLKRLETCRKALVTHPEDKEYMLAYIAIYLMRSGQFQECINHCKEVIQDFKIKDCIEDTRLFMSFSLQRLERYEEVIELRKVMYDEDEERKYFHLKEICDSYEKLKDYPNSIKYYEQMVKDADGNVEGDVFSKLAKFYDKVGDYKNAFNHYELAAQNGVEDSSWHWCMAGRALSLMGGDIDESMFYFKMALKLKPKYELAHYYLGVSYKSKGDIYMAMHHYSEAIRINPEFHEGMINLSELIFHEINDIEGARRMMEAALALNPKGKALTILYSNLTLFYREIKEFDKEEYYKAKYLESRDLLTEEDL